MALKDYYKKQIGQLNNLITLLLGSLNKGDRQKVIEEKKIFFHLGDDNLHNRCPLQRCGELHYSCPILQV